MGIISLYIILKVCNALFIELGLSGAAESCATFAFWVGWTIVVAFPILFLDALINSDDNKR